MLFLEDVHWADASTVDLISYLADRFDALHMLLVVTYRPSDLHVSRHPFAEVQLHLHGHGDIRDTRLRAFDQQDLADYLSLHYPDHRLPDEFVALLHSRTEGTPLFVVDLMRQLVNRGVVSQADGAWILDDTVEGVEAELPQSIRSVIQRTVDRLDETDRQLLVAASIQGSEFDSAIVASAIQMDSAAVEERLDRLEKVHAIVRFVDERVLAKRTPSLRYAFAHILYQNTLQTTLRGTRRVALSAAVSEVMEKYYGDDSAQASRLGILHLAALQFDKAAARFLQAARLATRLFASKEAVLLARRGLEALESLPDNADGCGSSSSSTSPSAYRSPTWVLDGLAHRSLRRSDRARVGPGSAGEDVGRHHSAEPHQDGGCHRLPQKAEIVLVHRTLQQPAGGGRSRGGCDGLVNARLPGCSAFERLVMRAAAARRHAQQNAVAQHEVMEERRSHVQAGEADQRERQDLVDLLRRAARGPVRGEGGGDLKQQQVDAATAQELGRDAGQKGGDHEQIQPGMAEAGRPVHQRRRARRGGRRGVRGAPPERAPPTAPGSPCR